jgi:pyruvate dehydrogenase E2 component (dihydrolipoamide acetyltransferase)
VAKQQVTVPDIGGAEDAEVIELLVAVGDEVQVDQGLIVLESDKASMEIPSSLQGIVLEVLVREGETLSEGSPVAVIETDVDESQAPPPESEQEIPEAVAAEPEPAGSEPVDESTAPATQPAEIQVVVPDIGTDEAVELIEICIAEGDSVAEGDSLVVLESDKASMEVPAPVAGEILKVLVSEGDRVQQGHELVVISGSAPVDAAPIEPAAPEPALVPSPAAEPVPAVPEAETAERPLPATSDGKVYAGPAVRKLAREFGITVSSVPGSGPRGRILKEDLHQHVQKSLSDGRPAAAGGAGIAPIPEIDFSTFGEVELVDRSKMDKVTATNMQRSWLNVPHVTQFDEADITELEEFRASLKAEAEQRNTRLTPMPFLLKACAVALRDNPKLNSSLAHGGEQLAYKKYCHIGMAVDTPTGLLVPVIRDVDRKSIWDLADEVIEMAGKARDRKLTPADMQGGCFTISSLGNIGGQGFTPIVNAPEVGILGVSKAVIKPVWDGQEFAPRKMLPLSLSYDHRVVNGGDGGRFFTRLVALLGDIRQLVM